MLRLPTGTTQSPKFPGGADLCSEALSEAVRERRGGIVRCVVVIMLLLLYLYLLVMDNEEQEENENGVVHNERSTQHTQQHVHE